ncbi:reverse transcriptase domain-containing protein [Tanacetum coccineum]
MRSLPFTKNQTKPLMKHGNVLKDSFVNVLTMAFSELHQSIAFYNSLNSNSKMPLDSAHGVSTDAHLSNSSSSNNSFDMQQIAASLEDKMTIKMNKMLNEMKALVVTTPAPVKAVEERCTTCGLPALQSTRMTLELANCSLCVPKGIARDVLVPVGGFNFPADFVVVDFECNYRVPLILGRPFLRTARVLIDVHGEELS